MRWACSQFFADDDKKENISFEPNVRFKLLDTFPCTVCASAVEAIQSRSIRCSLHSFSFSRVYLALDDETIFNDLLTFDLDLRLSVLISN